MFLKSLNLIYYENTKETTIQYEFTDIDWEDYFYDIIGVTMPENKTALEVV